MANAKFASLVTDFSRGSMIGRRGETCFNGDVPDIGEQFGVDEDVALGRQRAGGHDGPSELKCWEREARLWLVRESSM